jgi:hypothetical protein
VANEPDADTVNAPPETVSAPVNVFAPPNVNPADPDFVSPALPETTPSKTVALLIVAVVAADNTAFPVSVNAPLFVASPNTKEPLKSIALANVRGVALSLEIRPPLKTNVPVPSAALLPTWIPPAERSTPPMKSFAPVSVSTDKPFFLKEPLLFVINPLKVVSLDPLTVNRLVSRSTTPDPASEAISSSLASFIVPFALTVTAMLFANALPPLNVNVPAFTTVAPLNVFTPDNVNSPAPSFVRSYAPLTTPLSVTPLATVNVVAPESAAAPVNVNAPLFVPSPSANAPLNPNAFVTVLAVPPLLEIFPALNTTVPLPNAASFPTNTAPPLTVAPPLKVFVPVSVSAPLPLFTKLPLPLITPL